MAEVGKSGLASFAGRAGLGNNTTRTMNNSNDLPGIAAIDRALAADPRNVRALIAKADHFAAAGDSRSASAFYLAALRAAPPADKIPPDLLPELRRAQETCARHAREYKDYLRTRLVDRGFDARTSRPLRAVARHRVRRKAHLRAGAALLLFPRAAPDPVLRTRSVPVAGRRRGRDRRDPRRAARSHAQSSRVLALRDRRPEPAAQGTRKACSTTRTGAPSISGRTASR